MPVNSFDNYPMSWRPDKAMLKTPYYKSLSEDLEYRIIRGELKEGERLPPQREIADYLDLNYTTITRVYENLKRKGLIYGIVGRGTFVARDIRPAEAPQIIDLGAAGGFENYSSIVAKAVQRVMEKGYLGDMYENAAPAGSPHQLAAGQKWVEQMGVKADRDHIIICAGAQSALTLAMVSLFSQGDAIATDEYTHANFIGLARLLNIRLRPVPGDDSGMFPEELDRLCKSEKIKGIYLMPCCANPTTVTMTEKRRVEIARVAAQNKLVIIEDGASSGVFTAESTIKPFYEILPEQTVYICSTSRSLWGGLRVGYMAFGDPYRRKLLEGLNATTIRTSSLDAEIITELILSGDAYEIVDKKRRMAKRANEIFERYMGTAAPSGSMYSFYRWLPVPGITKRAEDALRESGVKVYHGSRFKVDEGADDNFLRVSISGAGSMRRLEKGIKILSQWYKTYMRQEKTGGQMLCMKR